MLSREDLDQILEAFQGEGMKFQLSTNSVEEVQNIVLNQGELCNIPEQSIIKLGNNITAIKDLPGLKYSETEDIKLDDRAELQAQKFWTNMQSINIYKVVKVILPKPVFDIVIANKPTNFSLMLGEALPDTSPAFQFMQTAPNAKGSVLRNISHGDAERDPDGVDLSPGQYQAGATLKHKHDSVTFVVYDTPAQLRSAPFSPWYTSVAIAPFVTRDLLKGDTHIVMLTTGASVSKKENRMSNIRVLMVWRIA